MERYSNDTERAATRLPLWTWAAGVFLLAIIIGWGFVDLAGRLYGDRTVDTRHRSNQETGQSLAGRQGPLVPSTDPSLSGRQQNANEQARQIDQSVAPLTLSYEQREKIKSLIAAVASPPRAGDHQFTVSIGAAVPKQIPLKQIPTDLASALNGFPGQDYVLVGNQLVIVDAGARRVVAIIPQVAPR
jgi:hypothetical protein